MTATEDVEYSYAAAATDPEGDTLTWGVVAGTDTCGGSFTGNTYTFTPAGPVPDANCEVAVEVCDTNLDCDTQSATVAIASVNDAPAITSTVPTTATEEVEYSFTATANDPEGDTLTWSVAGADTCGGSFAEAPTRSRRPARRRLRIAWSPSTSAMTVRRASATRSPRP